jgi:hypothetical protein
LSEDVARSPSDHSMPNARSFHLTPDSGAGTFNSETISNDWTIGFGLEAPLRQQFYAKTPDS